MEEEGPPPRSIYARGGPHKEPLKGGGESPVSPLSTRMLLLLLLVRFPLLLGPPRAPPRPHRGGAGGCGGVGAKEALHRESGAPLLQVGAARPGQKGRGQTLNLRNLGGRSGSVLDARDVVSDFDAQEGIAASALERKAGRSGAVKEDVARREAKAAPILNPNHR